MFYACEPHPFLIKHVLIGFTQKNSSFDSGDGIWACLIDHSGSFLNMKHLSVTSCTEIPLKCVLIVCSLKLLLADKLLLFELLSKPFYWYESRCIFIAMQLYPHEGVHS